MYIPLKIYALVWEYARGRVRVRALGVFCCAEEGGVTTFTVWVLRADGLSSGQPADWRRGHMGVVTSRQRYANPLTDLDEVRLPNPRKTKVQSVRADKSSTTAAPPVWENFTSLGLMQPFNYGILMMERSRAFTLLMLMVSKCSLVKVDYVFSVELNTIGSWRLLSVFCCECFWQLASQCQITINAWLLKQLHLHAGLRCMKHL